VLGKLIEKYLFISMGRYEFQWLERPGVMAIFALTAMVLLWPLGAAIYRRLKPAHAGAPATATGHATTTPTPDPSPQGGGVQFPASAAFRASPSPLVGGGAIDGAINVPHSKTFADPEPSTKHHVTADDIIGALIWMIVLAGFAAAFYSASGWRLSARLMPQTAAAAGLIVIACAGLAALASRFAGARAAVRRPTYALAGPDEVLSAKTVYTRLGAEVAWLIGLLAGVWIIGLMPAMGVYMFSYMATAGRTRPITALVITAALWAGFYVLFDRFLHVPWPPSLVGDMFPDLREWFGRLI
jgi:hypothetical protein